MKRKNGIIVSLVVIGILLCSVTSALALGGFSSASTQTTTSTKITPTTAMSTTAHRGAATTTMIGQKTTVNETPDVLQARALAERYFYYKSLYNSSLVSLLEELGLVKTEYLELREHLTNLTEVPLRHYENALADVIDVFTMMDEFVSDGEMDEGEILLSDRRNHKGPLSMITVKDVRATGTTPITVYEIERTGHTFEVTVSENGENVVYDMTLRFVDNDFVVYGCERR
ncbi:MAG: hypothetical protein IJF42_04645 [Clostridia bacterium]|nr:hypothetical protein [Clostridia bacterium]MBQ7302232.1 hypothetical protein [Clostridia bacterium]